MPDKPVSRKMARVDESTSNRSMSFPKRFNRYLEEVNFAVSVIVLSAVLMIAAVTGYFVGSSEHQLDPEKGTWMVSEENGTNYVVDQYNIKFLEPTNELMEDRSGFTYSYQDDLIAVRNDMDVKNTYIACVHEKIHNMGVGSGEYNHGMIHKYDDQIVDETCLKPLYLMDSEDYQK